MWGRVLHPALPVASDAYCCGGSAVEVTFVGCGDAFGSGGRFQTCLRVVADGAEVLVDCGSTSLTAMKAQSLDPQAVDAVAITHLHGDHVGGLPLLVLDGQFAGRRKPLTVLGPPGTEQRLHELMEASFPGSTQVRRKFSLEVVELAPGADPVSVGPVDVRGWLVQHPSGAPPLALRIQAGGRAFGYSGDTSWTPALLTAAARTDLFACEAYTYGRPVPHHLDYDDVLAHARELDTARLVLTHLGPSMLARRAGLEHQSAYDGLTVAL